MQRLYVQVAESMSFINLQVLWPVGHGPEPYKKIKSLERLLAREDIHKYDEP